MGTFYHIDQLDKIRMLQGFEEMVLALDFSRLYGHEHLDGNFLFVFETAPLEDVSVAASSDFVRDGILIKFPG